MNILITSAGRRVSLVEFAKCSVRHVIGDSSRVIAIDLSPALSPACRAADLSFPIGRFSSDSYMPDLVALCHNENVGLVIPTIDTELQIYAEYYDAFKEHGIHISVPEYQLVANCRDKRKTIELFDALGVSSPRLLTFPVSEFPAFIKPVSGSSSQNLYLVNDESELQDFMCDQTKYIQMEYLSPKDHDEYTVDLYYDLAGQLKCAVPRLRIATRSGEISKGITRKGAVYDFVWEKFSSLPGARGCVTLQLFHKKQSSSFYGIEINPRFGGGYPLAHLSGANYLEWLIRETYLEEAIPIFEDWKENTLLLRYDAESVVYDFDY